MENGGFAPWSKCSILHNIFKYMIFHRRQKALLWSKGLTLFILMDFPIQINTIRMELSIIYFKGSHVEISKYLCTDIPDDCIFF